MHALSNHIGKKSITLFTPNNIVKIKKKIFRNKKKNL